MRILILRHGETEWNTCARLQGQQDIDLDENGIRLAHVTAANTKDLPVDICFTSPLKRARNTAELVLAGRNVPIIDDARLMEISFGSFEGKRCAKHEAEVSDDFLDTFYDRPFEFKAPEGGETSAQLCDRIESFIRDLTAREDLMDKNVMLSCHGCSSRALLYMMGTERVPEKFWRGCVPPNLSISTVDYINGKFKFVDLDHIYYDRKEWKNSYAR